MEQVSFLSSRIADEHGRLGISGATNRLNIGDKIRLVPGHCDPTVNLYDWYVGIRASRVEQIWPAGAPAQLRPRVATPYDRMSRSCVPRTIPSK
jgi:D-serine deaminase-like pyridoxal phosphate-dependent protein